MNIIRERRIFTDHITCRVEQWSEFKKNIDIFFRISIIIINSIIYNKMAMETGFVVAFTSILTIVITKFKLYIKKNGRWTCGCGFTDKPLLDDDDLEVKEFDMTYLDALLDYCEKYQLEPEMVKPLITKSLKEKVEVDARNLNFLPKVAQLPI